MYEPTSTEDICMCGDLGGLSKGLDVVVLFAQCIRVYMRASIRPVKRERVVKHSA